MSVMSSGRCLTVALAVALSASACAKVPPTEKGEKEAAMSEDSSQSRTIDGYTYTTAPVVAKLGPHRYAFPANLYDDQIGPAIGGGVGLTLMWPELRAAPPGTRSSRTMADHHRAISMAVDHIDKVPITELLGRQTSTDATSEEGSIYRKDPRRRLDLRRPGRETLGLTPYAIDEEQMAVFAKAYELQIGLPVKRNPNFEDDWYIARDASGKLETFIKCSKLKDGHDGLALQGDQLVINEKTVVSSCTHNFVDTDNSLSVSLSYPRIFLKDWKKIEAAARQVLAQYKVE